MKNGKAKTKTVTNAARKYYRITGRPRSRTRHFRELNPTRRMCHTSRTGIAGQLPVASRRRRDRADETKSRESNAFTVRPTSPFHVARSFRPISSRSVPYGIHTDGRIPGAKKIVNPSAKRAVYTLPRRLTRKRVRTANELTANVRRGLPVRLYGRRNMN